jgi:hypothetical protein
MQRSRIERSKDGVPMSKATLVTLAAILAGGSALAQPAGQVRRSSEVPVDHGPFTPEANSAYQGGGVILQGAPGAPAPSPEPTPAGQMPRNMVPPR